MGLELPTVLAITALAYWFGDAIKASKIDNKWIPALVGLFGIVLGVAAFQIGMPSFPAQDIITAAAVGVGSALAATGLNQVYKQLSKKKDQNEDCTVDTNSSDTH